MLPQFMALCVSQFRVSKSAPKIKKVQNAKFGLCDKSRGGVQIFRFLLNGDVDFKGFS